MNFSAIFLSLAFLQAALVPTDSPQFFVVPDTESVIRFEDSGDANQAPASEFTLCDVNGTEIRKVSAQVTKEEKTTRYEVCLTLPQGYWELQNSGTDQAFGIVSLPAFCEEKEESRQKLQEIVDPFFAIDGAMSWLVCGPNADQKRDELAQIARRSGIGMLRERLSWNECQSAAGPQNVHCEPNRHYDSSRKSTAAHGVLVLELCHDAPAWMPKTAEKYPQNFHEMRDSWDVFTQKWNRTWGGMEVWNEPDISFGAFLPADQYVPLLKTIAYQQQNSDAEKQKLAQTGTRTPIVSCVMATYHRPWLDSAAECGVLEACDVFSFHTYSRAPDMEKLFSLFQSWLRDSGYPTKPMWLTECGRPWSIGPGRPPQEQDLVSAIDIVMKGVEARAFGVQRYFPFVFPYYEERTSNFGMLSRDYTPLRSFGAYAQSVRVLAHREYLGDLPLSEEATQAGWTHARLFSPIPGAESSEPLKSSCVAVIYASEIKKRRVSLPCQILHAERITGEPVAFDSQTRSLESVDGFVYVWLADAQKHARTETFMNQVRKERLGHPEISTSVTASRSPIILRYALDEKNVEWTANGYQFNSTCNDELTLKIVASNLSNETKTVPVQCRALCRVTKITAPESVTVPANGTAEFEVKVIPGVDFMKQATNCPIQITADDQIVVRIQVRATLEQLVQAASKTEKMNLKDFSSWTFSAGSCCDQQKFSESGENWVLMAHFKDGDHWIYPQFALPEEMNLANYDGIILRARCWDSTNQTAIRFFAFQPECAYFTSEGILRTDGEWQNVKIPFSVLSRCTAAGGKSAEFQPEKVRKISIGANTKGESLMLEVSDFYFYHK